MGATSVQCTACLCRCLFGLGSHRARGSATHYPSTFFSFFRICTHAWTVTGAISYHKRKDRLKEASDRHKSHSEQRSGGLVALGPGGGTAGTAWPTSTPRAKFSRGQCRSRTQGSTKGQDRKKHILHDMHGVVGDIRGQL